ncbi:MAG: FAD-binding oxidoreductase [Polyangiaceae bacterium]|nr:FAD-binding oxidoreductase [Polyangiaceae bacterium]
MDLASGLRRALPELPVGAGVAERLTYARDLWPRHHLDVRAGRVGSTAPAAVAWPSTTAEVRRVLEWAREEGARLVPFGAGSGVCGAILPDRSTLVVDLKRMRHRRVDRERMTLDAGPGVMGYELEEDLAREGLTVGHFPSSILCSTVGGWVAARGAGQCSGRYGKIEDMVVDLETVTGGGELAELRRRRSGPSLVPLWIGSEGTLGVITRVGLRLHAAPPARGFAAWSFPTVEAGWEAMRALFQAGLRPAVARLYDAIDSAMMGGGHGGRRPARAPRASRPAWARLQASIARRALRLPRALNHAIEASEGWLLGGCTLVLLFEGTEAECAADRARAAELCRAGEGRDLGEDPARRWLARRYAISYHQAPVFRLGAFSDTMEVSAPWSRLGALYHGVRRALGEHVLVMAHLSHAYPDGCSIYFTFTGAGRTDDEALGVYDRAWAAALDAAVAAGGTLSHHHGVGRSKAARLRAELGDSGVELFAALRRIVDPARVLNVGNLEAPAPEPGARRAPHPPFPGEGIDEASLLATVSGARTLGELEATLGARGLTLGLGAGRPPPETTVAAFLAAGAPGARDPWDDPVDTIVAGFAARLRGGRELVVHPAPRRAVGPDWLALISGAGERCGEVTRACVRVRRRDAPDSRALPAAHDRDPAWGAGEQPLTERVLDVLATS